MVALVGCGGHPNQPSAASAAPPPSVKAVPVTAATVDGGLDNADPHALSPDSDELTEAISTGLVAGGPESQRAQGSGGGPTLDLGQDTGTKRPQGGGGGLRGQPIGVPKVTSVGDVTVSAGLDKAIIRRYVRRNLNKIQYCYEKKLVRVAGLHGNVTVKFTIEKTGLVTNTKASGFDIDVVDCLVETFNALEFPKPKDGATVKVSYPFTFSSTRDQ
ncbi:MAG: domain containing protein [Myxococcales bacterium]|nr:domain containing protein [Myxococcales bacterium]